jgi:uncharacterized UPF0160 family protein
MFLFSQKKKIVTHPGGFHTDDVFAAATVILFYKKNKTRWSLERTDNQVVIDKADVVFDIGGVHNESSLRFDHHQKGGAGTRHNGIPYASFGLVWKYYGPRLCEKPEDVSWIDSKLVQPIDASDNGVNIMKSLHSEINPVTIEYIIGSFNTVFGEDSVTNDTQFLEAVFVAQKIIERFILSAKEYRTINKKVSDYFYQSTDKRVVLVEEPLGRFQIGRALQDYKEVFYYVYPSNRGDQWNVCAMRASADGFETKKPFPESWRGLRDEDFVRVSQIKDAIFCHNSGFLAGAQTKESALLLAKIALEA